MKFQIYRRLTLRGYKWRWRLRAANGEIIASGQSYARRIDAEGAIKLVKGSAESKVETAW